MSPSRNWPDEPAESEDDTSDQDAMDLPLDPGEEAADIMVSRYLTALGTPTIDAAALVVVDVPSGSWVQVVATAWRAQTWEKIVEDDCDERSPGRGQRRESPPLEFLRDGNRLSDNSNRGNSDVAKAILGGRGILGISQSPAQLLPSDLVRSADLRMTVLPPDGSVIHEVAARVTGGSPPSRCLPDERCRRITPDTLRLAMRRGQTADAYVDRLEVLLSDRQGDAPVQGLDQLPGMAEAVSWGKALKRDITDYRAGRISWRQVDRGVLLEGVPGIGKTTFARAVAQDCGVPLIATSYADWQATKEGHLGDVTRAMRSSFDHARVAAPCILFIDELDTLGVRGSGRRYDDWWRALINALLELLDGISDREGIVVIGATNDASHIDAAISRSGRLDRLIRIPLPDTEALVAIIRVHLGGDLADADLSASALAGLGGTGADAERWVRGARRRARQGGRPMAVDDLFSEIVGTDPAYTPEYRGVVAVHEAGHAVARAVMRPGSLNKAEIRCARVQITQQSNQIANADWLREEIIIWLAGRAAEHELLGEPTGNSGGPENSDLARATTLATAAETSLGLGEKLTWLGFRDQSETAHLLTVRPDIAARVTARLDDAYARARAFVRDRRAAIEAVAKALLTRGLLSGPEIEAIVVSTSSGPCVGGGP